MPRVDYYKVLDISPSASTTDIKTAYHRAAKRAHPDAGGNAEAMQLVNEAYAKLSDPTSRRDYDTLRTSPVRPDQPMPTPAPSAPVHHPPPVRHYPGATPPHQAHLDSLARRSAWRIIGYNALATVLLGFVTSFMFNITTDPASRIILALAAFAPAYFLMCGIIFLFRPRLRIALARLGGAHWPSLRDLMGLLVLGLSALPLAGIWLIGYFNNTFR